VLIDEFVIMIAVANRLSRNNNINGYDTLTKHHRTIVRLISFLVILLTLHGIIAGRSNLSQERQHRQLESSLAPPENNNVVVEPPRDCSISRPEPRSMKPTMIASYPGSGAKLTWKLTRAVTGVMTGDDFNHNGLVGKGQVVGIKTHYPSECCSNIDAFTPLLLVDQSVLLLRHPMKAIPSYHNFMYERENGLKNHSTRAPLETWIEWRDANFDEQLTAWISLVKFWMGHHSNEQRLITTYEKLIEKETGPKEIYRLGHFVMRGDGLASPEEDIVCLWDYIVNTRADENTRRSSKRQGDPSLRPYTEEQLNTMLNELKTLKNLYPGEFTSVIEEYLSTIYRSQESMKTAAFGNTDEIAIIKP